MILLYKTVYLKGISSCWLDFPALFQFDYFVVVIVIAGAIISWLRLLNCQVKFHWEEEGEEEEQKEQPIRSAVDFPADYHPSRS